MHETELTRYELALLVRMLGARTIESFNSDVAAEEHYALYRKLKHAFEETTNDE